MAERVLRIQFEGGASSNVDESQAVLNDQITGSQTPGTEAVNGAILYGGGKKLNAYQKGLIGIRAAGVEQHERNNKANVAKAYAGGTFSRLDGLKDAAKVKGAELKALTSIAGPAVGVAALGIGTTVANNYINNMSTIKGDIAGANELNNTINGMGKLMNLGSGIAAGAMVGGVPGAIAGAIISGTMTAINMANEVKQINNERTLDAIQSNKSKEALGLLSSNGFRK